ncbi:immunoglobulin-like domain-containing protein [Xylocopilactobacillus apicola]|uniref:Pesticidal crystal protein Cry22Aa Ig-like domain-containing protein n=1 Tax=Xylocopilactobacillus apicola TaxID=2932184 RepID=A0AAU9D819_9LACO|nr:immunoglobulin-like domain-containing protein [Xylocopilactobacillus apicola]BDR59698.1 hypothetical protein XA3_21390 [Xylocopilactobacillus apicola]
MKANHKFKFAGLASTALLLLSPVAGAFTGVAQAITVHADDSSWDYDVDNPGLGQYDKLLQNAGPSDGQVDWYPAEHFASSSNIRASKLVQQLIDLSIATNDASSNARHVLFNDTKGGNPTAGYDKTYEKYKLALGFIAQILAFNNQKPGVGSYLHQGFESDFDSDGKLKEGIWAPNKEDVIATTGKTPDPDILAIPKIGEGVNISDVLGTAFFGNPNEAYAQLYINGYDNVAQNEENIIHESTSSITLMAQSKITGRKATAVFKLNNKTFNVLPEKVLLENNIDSSPSSKGEWGTRNFPDSEGSPRLGDSTAGTFNQRTNLKNGLTQDQQKLIGSGGSTAWVDPDTGSGTIVVPRGTDAATIAKKIKALGYQSNFNISNVAPMKAIHGDNVAGTLATDKNSYNASGVVGSGPSSVTFGDNSLSSLNPDLNATSISNDQFDGDGKAEDNYIGVADPRLTYDHTSNTITGANNLKSDFSNSLLFNPFNTNNKDETGIGKGGYNNDVAKKIPNQADTDSSKVDSVPGPAASVSDRDANFQGNLASKGLNFWPAYSNGNTIIPAGTTSVHNDANGSQNNDTYGKSTYAFGGPTDAFGGGAGSVNLKVGDNNSGVDGQLGDVVHAFEPSSGVNETKSPFMVREAWDDTHSIFGTAPFTGMSEETIKNQIANNGSFNNTSGDEIKKSFTFTMPLNNTVLKSYRNPYSTVISTALPFSKDSGIFKSGIDYDANPLTADGKGDPFGTGHNAAGNDSDMNATSVGFTGAYIYDSVNGSKINQVSKLPATNPWYVNHGTANKDVMDYNDSIEDTTGNANINIQGKNGSSDTDAKSLHLSTTTWESKSWGEGNQASDKPGIYNASPDVQFNKGTTSPTTTTTGDLDSSSDVQYNNVYDTWLKEDSGKIKGRVFANEVGTSYMIPGENSSDQYPHDHPLSPAQLGYVKDANNKDQFNKGTDAGSKFIDPNGYTFANHQITNPSGGVNVRMGWLVPGNDIDPSDWGPGKVDGYARWDGQYVVTSAHQTHSQTHKQFAKNAGYVLINASGLSEDQSKKLSKYQVPDGVTNPGSITLDGISNYENFNDLGTHATNRPYISPVNDDLGYRGGLLGVMSIHGNSTDSGIVKGTYDSKLNVTQSSTIAGSIYNRFLGTPSANDPVFLDAPGLTNGKVRVDGKGEFATDTDLHYGLAWNDSSDLPQVKIKRSLNVQYLVPVSVARDVKTTWTQDLQVRSVSLPTGYTWDRKQSVKTEYNNYKLYLGDVALEDAEFNPGNEDKIDFIDTNSNGSNITPRPPFRHDTSLNNMNVIQVKDALKGVRPVNNQIAYTRIDQSFPHYDSELFDQGSNTKALTTHQGEDDGVFVGSSAEMKTKSSDPKTIGTSDDYSIGIVKAPSKFFKVNEDGSLANGQTTLTNTADAKVEHSVENLADGKKGINKTMDVDENDNGMAISDPTSYSKLSDAYNVNISADGKVTAKDDDENSKSNQENRVALVQQLMDNGGNANAYYYIPSLPRLYENWNKARINVVVYDKAAVPAPTKQDTKPSFATTDVSRGNDPFNVKLRPYTTVYDDGAVLTEANVPQNFKNILAKSLVAGNPDYANNTEKLQQLLVNAFLGSWQQNNGSFDETDTGAGVKSPLYLYGGFGISNSDSKNSYDKWPTGYANPEDNTSKYHEALTNFSGDFYRGGADLKDAQGNTIANTKVPASSIKVDISKLDLTKAGSYPVVYTYTNPSNDKDTASITVPVQVTDQSAPVFAFQGTNDVTINVGENFDPTAYKVVGSWNIFNKYNGDYDQLVNYEGIAKDSKGDPDVTISGTVDTTVAGIYQLTYKATNASGIQTVMTRYITVLPKEAPSSEWSISDYNGVGYVNYVPGYGINVWNAPAGTFTGQRLQHGTAWKVFQKATNSKGQTFYNVGKNQWIDGQYVSFAPVTGGMETLDGIVTIKYVPGYGVNLWKDSNTTGGYYEGRKLQDGTEWKTFGQKNGFYKVGENQWVQGDYASYRAK